MNDSISTNAEKAARVAGFAEVYIQLYEGGHGEAAETILCDIVADLCHWYMSLPASQREDYDDPTEGVGRALLNAEYHFECEVNEAKEEATWQETES